MAHRKKAVILLLLFLACFVFASRQQDRQAIGVEATTVYFKERGAALEASLKKLKASIELSDFGKTSQKNCKQVLIESRQAYKQIEFFVEYFFSHTSNIFNRPLSYEIETPFIEYEEPIGLQVIEDLLFNEPVPASKPKLLMQVDVLITSAENLNAVLFTLHISDEQILESLRLELIRIGTLGITGFDAPELKTGINEAATSLAAMETVLAPYISTCTKSVKDSLTSCLMQNRKSLLHTDFNSFDRLNFLTQNLFSLQKWLGRLITDLNLELNTVPQINYNAANLFAKDFFRKEAFTKAVLNQPSLVALGKKLFFENRLSQNSKTSCASCHAPEKFFSDGRTKSISFNGLPVRRNSPSILYAVYQQQQFLDGREKTLEDQVEAVLLRTTDMTGHPQALLQTINRDTSYQELFQKALPDSAISFSSIATAIAAYEATLTPFASAFDAFMNGREKALTVQQKKGFNLFMGKAKCATCHFAPLFNGLFPPYYQVSELEILGTPATANFLKPVLDKDSGQFHTIPLPFTVGAFKTPTVRNAAVTAPYMHNGVFSTLNKVMEFYDKGGGQGLGIRLEHQTLSPRPLKLSVAEKQALIAFLQSLTDAGVSNKSVN